MTNDTVRSKNLYKTFLSILKFIPSTLSIVQIIGLLLNYIGVSNSILTCFGGASFLFVGLLFIMSYIFRFCYLYRIPLWYTTIIISLNLFRNLGLIPIALILFYRICLIVTGIFISLFVGYMYINRNNPKIDHIKQLCESYAECCSK